MSNEPLDLQEDVFVVNNIHIGADVIQLIDPDGAIMYFKMTDSCQRDQEQKAEALLQFWMQEGKSDV
jgi:hypothetical protein